MTPSSIESAQRFLQTVVVIDDNAYSSDLVEEPPASLGSEDLEEPASASAFEDSGRVGSDGLDELDYVSAEGLDTQAIVRGFAELGMTAAVLAPNAGAPLSEDAALLKAASSADVLVLDWIIRAPGRDEII